MRGAGPAAATSFIHSPSTPAAFPHLPLRVAAKLQKKKKRKKTLKFCQVYFAKTCHGNATTESRMNTRERRRN